MIRALSCITFAIIVSSCSSSNEQIKKEQILAFVGDRTITIQDFFRRAEYSIRPTYCRQSNYVHKKIVLNSLIAEKMTALEMDKKNDEILESTNFQKFLRGRREQAMRQVFYNDSFYDSVSLSEDDIMDRYALAGRSIQIEYLSLPDLDMVQKFKELLNDDMSLDAIYSYLWQGDVPSRTINWFDREPEMIHDGLFREDLEKGEVIGPFMTDDNSYLVIQVKGWVDQPVITKEEQGLRWNDVSVRLTEKIATAKYKSYVSDLMSDKKMELEPETFNSYARIAGDYYLKDEKDKKIALNQAMWDNVKQVDLEPFNDPGHLDPSATLFRYDGRSYSVGDLNEMLRSHPLVFRKRKMGKGEFRSQLKFAIADLLRDIELTRICYELGLDNDWRVESNKFLWDDAYASKRYMEIHGLNDSSTDEELLGHFDPIIDSLQQAYTKQIKINMNAFEKIELSSTDMLVTQRGLPYPIVVPSFPIITSDNRLDYGSIIK